MKDCVAKFDESICTKANKISVFQLEEKITNEFV
jgi:hypothetical protein